MKNIHNLFILVCIMFIASCEEDKPTIVPMPSEMKEWAWFKPGSYWVYQNDSTNEMDSVFVVKAYLKSDSNYADGQLQSIVDKIVVEMLNSKNNRISINASKYCDVIERYENGYFKKTFRFLFVDKNNSIIKDSAKYYYNESSILNNIFTDIYKYNSITYYNDINSSDSNASGSTINEYLIARRCWIIKKIEKDNLGTHYWSLLRFNIVQ